MNYVDSIFLYLQLNIQNVSHFTYFSMNFLWKPDLRVSLMNGFSFLSGSSIAQFLNTTSSSHRLLTLNSAGLLFNNGLPLKMFSVRILSSWAFLSASYKTMKEINKICITITVGLQFNEVTKFWKKSLLYGKFIKQRYT